MALPTDLYTVAVTASFKDAGGAALPGTVTFTLSALLADGTGNVVIPAYPKPYTLSAGALTAGPLVANDNADLLPANSTYLVTVALQNLQQYSYSVQLLAAPLSFTATSATPCVFTAAGSAYANGTAVTLTGGSLPAGFTAATTYYVVSASGTSFSLAATSGGSAIASTGTGSGTVSTASVDLSDLQPVVSQGTPVSYVPTSGGTYTGTIVLDGSPALQIPSGAAAGQVLTSDGSGNGVWAAPALVVKPEVQEATAAALPANAYASGVLTASSNGALTVDGIAVTAGDRVLVKNEVTAANNGVYVATSAGASGAKYVLTRSADMSIAADIPGAFIFVQQGTNNGNTGWMVTGAGPWTLGSTAITWAQFSAIPAIGLLTPTAAKTANYTAVSGDMVKTDTSGGSFTVTLPSAPPVNTTIGVKQIAVAGAGTNATTVACGGSDVLNIAAGPATLTLDRLNQTVILQYGTGGIWTVQATDPAVGQIATSRQGVYYLDSYTGTDDAKMTSAVAAVVAAGGGTIQLSPRSHAFANQWTSAFSGTRIKLRIQGTGAAPHGQSEGIPTGTTTCAMQYSGAGAAKIDFHHSGSIEIDHILFTDGTDSTVPFMQFTNAQPYVHDCTFKGDNSLQAANQDAIYFGGVGSIVTSGTDTDPFQAYQGVVERCSFSYIRTACWARTYANSISMRDLLIDNSCGSPNVFSVSDAAMTQGSAVLTSATAAFTSGMVGQAVVVAGAGSTVYGSYLVGYISAYTSATQVTLSANAASTVSAQVCIAPQAAPIMIGSPDPNGGVSGCVVDDCCIEVIGYVIGILLQKSDNNNVIGTAFWDGVSTSLVGVACVNSSFYNSVYLSEEGVNTPFSSDAQSTGLGNDLVLVNGQRPVFQIPAITSPGNLALKVQGLLQANYGSTATNFAIGTLSNYAYMGPFSTADAWYSVGGTNTNINMKLRAQGTGSVQILSKVASQFAGTPAIAAGAAAGTSPTVSVVGNDQRGTITVTTGTGSMAAGALATVTFTANGGSWVSAPYVVATPVATGGGALQPRISAQSTSAFTLSCDVAAANATTYTFNYICLA